MKIGFALPSASYNIVLTQKELKELAEGHAISFRPERQTSHAYDDRGGREVGGHTLRYDDHFEEWPIQYINVMVDKMEVEENEC